jgi:hypothetical protein
MGEPADRQWTRRRERPAQAVTGTSCHAQGRTLIALTVEKLRYEAHPRDHTTPSSAARPFDLQLDSTSAGCRPHPDVSMGGYAFRLHQTADAARGDEPFRSRRSIAVGGRCLLASRSAARISSASQARRPLPTSRPRRRPRWSVTVAGPQVVLGRRHGVRPFDVDVPKDVAADVPSSASGSRRGRRGAAASCDTAGTWVRGSVSH